MHILSAWVWVLRFTPHAMCLDYYRPLIVALIVGNAIVALSYFAIPLAFWKQARRQDGLVLPFSRRVLWLFGGFILACGLTHVADIVVLYVPWYWLDLLLVWATAFTSAACAYVFVPKVWRLYNVPLSDLAQVRASVQLAITTRKRQATTDMLESPADRRASFLMEDALERLDGVLERMRL